MHPTYILFLERARRETLERNHHRHRARWELQSRRRAARRRS